MLRLLRDVIEVARQALRDDRTAIRVVAVMATMAIAVSLPLVILVALP